MKKMKLVLSVAIFAVLSLVLVETKWIDETKIAETGYRQGYHQVADPIHRWNQTRINYRNRRQIVVNAVTDDSPTVPSDTTSTGATGTTQAVQSTTTSPTTTIATSTGLLICPWGDWQSWTDCDCRNGVRTRNRDPKYIPHYQCEGPNCYSNCTIQGCAGESERCERKKCPIDCVYSKWSEWSDCSGPCGESIRRRYRRVRVPALYGGKKCTRFMEEKICVVHDSGCEPACNASPWSEWSDCRPTGQCGECYGTIAGVPITGIQVRHRVVYGSISHSCPAQEAIQCYLSCC